MPLVVLQDLAGGATELVDAPGPTCGPSEVILRAGYSAVSAGTERMLVDFGRANLVGKAMQQPQRVNEVLGKIRTDGAASTVHAVRSKLAQPVPLGYSSAGTVLEVGERVHGLVPGDLVAAAGPHAEIAAVPVNLTAKLPDGVPLAEASFATITSVALEGIRLAAPSLGERFVVMGLGLIGQLSVQLLSAHGCTVLGIDPNPERRRLAESFGATALDPSQQIVEAARSFSGGRGVDGVLICASTKSSRPVHDAAQMCRQRGRLILVGVTGLELDRHDFYEKELTFQVSASYGPGRYDQSYEAGGVDYPVGFVRWTAGRNMEAVLDLLATKKLDVASLITHEYALDQAPDAYETLVSDPSALGITLRYSTAATVTGEPTGARSQKIAVGRPPRPSDQNAIAVIGAGNFANQVLMPSIIAAGESISTVVSRRGTTAAIAAKRFHAAEAGTGTDAVFDDPKVGTVVIATRHDTHARLVERALRAGKHVFVEKPLALSNDQLAVVTACVEELVESGRPVPLLGIGFNRRFAPVTRRMVDLLSSRSAPLAINATMNAGAVSEEHWAQDPDIGGGRLVGEACHFIDLARFLVGEAIVDVTSMPMGGDGPVDTATITLRFADGSIASVNYFANGSKRFPKERVEVYSSGRVLVNDNFRTMRAYGWPGVRTLRLRSQDKGHAAGMATFLEAVRNGTPPPIPFDEIVEVTRISLRAAGLD